MKEVFDTAIFALFVIAVFAVLGNIGALQDPLVSITH